MAELSEEREAAEAIARESGRLLLSYFSTDRVHARPKGDRDVVTAADTASEALILDRLQSAFPQDGIVAEEGSAVGSSSGRQWYIDPLDATLNFSRNVPVWCVSLSLFEGERPILGVTYDPIRDELFSTARGQGATCNGSHLDCRSQTDLAAAFVHLTVDFNDTSMRLGLDDIQRVAPRVLRTRNIGSAALALAYVAAGRFDAMIHRFAHTWDYGAGVLLVEKAGGIVTDDTGAPYVSSTSGVLAAGSQAVHSGLLGVLRTSIST